MKTLVLLFALTVSLDVFCQEHIWKSENSDYVDDLPFNALGELVFSEVVDVPNIKPDDFYKNAIRFVCSYYNSPQTVLKNVIPNKEITISAIGSCAGCPKSMEPNYQVTIQLKEGKYRYTFKYNSMGAPTGDTPKEWFAKSIYFGKDGVPKKSIVVMKNGVIAIVENFSKNLKDYMTENNWEVAIKKNNWTGVHAEYNNMAPFRENGQLIYGGVFEAPGNQQELDLKFKTFHDLVISSKKWVNMKPLFAEDLSGVRSFSMMHYKGGYGAVVTCTSNNKGLYKYEFEVRWIYGEDESPGSYLQHKFMLGNPAAKMIEKMTADMDDVYLKLTSSMKKDLGLGKKKDDW